MTRKIHNILKKAGFVNCKNPAHHERGYKLKNHKGFSVIYVFFNSYELLEEAHLLLESHGIANDKKTTQGCLLQIKTNDR